MKYTIYDNQTGQILYHLTSTDPQQVELNLAGKSYVLGEHDSKKFLIQDGVIQPKPKDPSTDFEKYNFDFESKSWKLDIVASQKLIRKERDSLLSKVDKINPLWYVSLNQTQQNELAQYRQALLDVPQQSGFPTQIDWPAKPSWL
jgi:hypothetical protein